MSRGFDLLGAAAGAGTRKAADDGIEQLALIFLERQHIVGALLEHRCGEPTIAMQRIGGNDAALEAQHRQHLQGALGFVAAGCLARRQGHPRLRSEDIDHVQRRGALASLVGPAQRLAVDRDDTGEVQPIEFGKRHHEIPKNLLERLRVEQAEYPAECIVAGYPMLEPQELSQQSLLGTAEYRHVGSTLRTAQRCQHGDEQNLQQLVLRIGCSRISQPSENLLEFAHSTPLAFREPSTESGL